ncbi:UDP-N-acetylmuramoyl-L-alanine--D-glutamate ligase [Methylobacillus flagellatus]|uniref:UDP-N-acetylmuramoyl-L-alanine--D-glutamate ligase n=1 Tax=Methylobacillus flagellatus TaxID=405 RepID=UPI0010F8DBB1|nr:UDP-N-acetylmuramoyl-L-alanine--D-glutamate ligase [Methylobacillus flagellatus]
MKLSIKDKQVLVLGLGDTGLSALRWLKRQGARLSVADTRQVPPNLAQVQAEFPGITVSVGALQAATFAGADLVVISPGVPLAEPEVQAAIARGITVVGDVELFGQYRPASSKLIAITGANGKSTVTTLVGEMCKAAGLNTVVAGNIGLPVLEVLDDQQAQVDVYVLELSSFQLETTRSLNADAATVLNLSEDHMDRYSGMADYAAAKAHVFAHAGGGGVQVLNRDDAWSLGMTLPGRQLVHFGLGAPTQGSDFGLIQRDGADWLAQGAETLLPLSALRIAGLHNAANALAALALCRSLGLPWAPLLQALRDFAGLPHRVQWLAELNGVSFYDDSKGTNVGATCAALSGFPNKVVLIAGGDGKGQDFSPLRAPVAANARAVVLIGRDAPHIAAVLQDTGVPLLPASDLPSAVHIASAAAQHGDAVLLSPACASFDMFRNYLHRAEVFADAVQALKSGGQESAA